MSISVFSESLTSLRPQVWLLFKGVKGGIGLLTNEAKVFRLPRVYLARCHREPRCLFATKREITMKGGLKVLLPKTHKTFTVVDKNISVVLKAIKCHTAKRFHARGLLTSITAFSRLSHCALFFWKSNYFKVIKFILSHSVAILELYLSTWVEFVFVSPHGSDQMIKDTSFYWFHSNEKKFQS